jgi:TM2 domain-containing membrane protein YozV
MSPRQPLIAAALSWLLPGIGQLYNGERVKGWAILCMSAGTLGGMALAWGGPAALRSPVSVAFLGLIYVAVWLPAVIDAFQCAAGRRQTLLSGERAWYVIGMLLTVGPMALPFLWQSPRFSRRAKTGWTIAVILFAAGGILLILLIGPALQAVIDGLTGLSP